MGRRLIAGLTAAGLAACGAEDPDWPAVIAAVRTSSPSYQRAIRPMLADRCEPCHHSDGLRAGGVELDRLQSARSGAQHNVCVSVAPEVIVAFSSALAAPPYAPRTGDGPCGEWEPLSMPTGAKEKLTPVEQAAFARWVELGTPP
jgi:hypothetical protein